MADDGRADGCGSLTTGRPGDIVGAPLILCGDFSRWLEMAVASASALAEGGTLERVRVTWLTDLHLNFLDEGGLVGFLEVVRRERPELLLVGGDTGESDDVLEFVARLGSVAPTWFVLGNHDFYGSSIATVRAAAWANGRWLPGNGPVRLTDATTLIGVDGWGDARCGDLGSRIRLTDWVKIEELSGLSTSRRIEVLRELGAQEATQLAGQLEAVEPTRALLVLTHVPPFAGSCWYDGRTSDSAWLPWFTCIAVGEVLLAYARQHPTMSITALCGHTHGIGEFVAADNLVVRTGGWAAGQQDYGNPVVQATWDVA